MAILELTGVSKHFGAIRALSNVSLTLNPGEVVGLMGDQRSWQVDAGQDCRWQLPAERWDDDDARAKGRLSQAL